jgi:uncharacterized membrane protein YecN with MAPEG domain
MFSALLSLAPFAAILAFFYIFLTIHVVQMRRRARVALGTGRHEALTRAIRAHGNFAEYVPFCLVMLSLSALLGASSLLIIIGGLLLVVGRIAHS